MRAALADAGLGPGDVGCVNAHATSTPLGDQSELTALRGVFADRLRAVPVVANKSQLGHALGASCLLALILAVEGMRRGVALPTLNHVADERLPEAWIPPRAVEHRHDVTLVNSFGFGGTNVSIVVAGPPP
jgi:3-oxoacyl-[acyl-carrier-protein] synthase II